MWIGTILKKENGLNISETKKKYNDRKEKVKEEITEHFSGLLMSNASHMFGDNFLISYGTDILTKSFGFCECCSHYVGITKMKREIHKITVLNSYCKSLDMTVAPKQRCRFWEPDNFTKQLIYNYMNKVSNGDPQNLDWLYPNDARYKQIKEQLQKDSCRAYSEEEY